jgi:hypothetical protein
MDRMSLRRRLQILASENVKFREALLGEMRRMATTWPRRTYLPHSARDKEPFIPPGTDLEIWAWEDAGKIYGAAFAGKANKPLWQWRFPSEARRQQEIDSTIQRRKEHFADKERKQKERKEYQHGLELGTMLYRSGGYDQTNVDFYQVTKIVGKQIEIRKVEKKIVREEKTSVYVVPVPNKFIGAPSRKTPQSGGSGAYVKMDHGYAYLWDGKPKYETAGGYGH